MMEAKWEEFCTTRLDILASSVGSSDAFGIMLGLHRLPQVLEAKKEPFNEENFAFIKKLAGGLEAEEDVYQHLLGVQRLHERIKSEVAKGLGERWIVSCNQSTLRQVAMCKNSMYHGQLVPINGSLLPAKKQYDIITYWATQNPLINVTLFSRLVRTLWFYKRYLTISNELPNNVINDILVSLFFNHELVLPTERIYFSSFLRWLIKYQYKYIEEFFVLEPLFNLELENRCLLVNSKKFSNEVLPDSLKEKVFKKLTLSAYYDDEDVLLSTETYECYDSSPISYKIRQGSDSIPPVEYLINDNEIKETSTDSQTVDNMSYELENGGQNNGIGNVEDESSTEDPEEIDQSSINGSTPIKDVGKSTCNDNVQIFPERTVERCMVFIPDMVNQNISTDLISNGFMNSDPMLSTEQTSNDSINGDLLSNSTMNTDLISSESMTTDFNGNDQIDELLIDDPIRTDMVVNDNIDDDNDDDDVEILDVNIKHQSKKESFETVYYYENENGCDDEDFNLELADTSEDEKPIIKIKKERKERDYNTHYSLRNNIRPSNLSFIHSRSPIKRHSFKFKDPLKLRLARSVVKPKFNY